MHARLTPLTLVALPAERRDGVRVLDQATRALRQHKFLERLDQENSMADQFPEAAAAGPAVVVAAAGGAGPALDEHEHGVG